MAHPREPVFNEAYVLLQEWDKNVAKDIYSSSDLPSIDIPVKAIYIRPGNVMEVFQETGYRGQSTVLGPGYYGFLDKDATTKNFIPPWPFQLNPAWQANYVSGTLGQYAGHIKSLKFRNLDVVEEGVGCVLAANSFTSKVEPTYIAQSFPIGSLASFIQDNVQTCITVPVGAEVDIFEHYYYGGHKTTFKSGQHITTDFGVADPSSAQSRPIGFTLSHISMMDGDKPPLTQSQPMYADRVTIKNTGNSTAKFSATLSATVVESETFNYENTTTVGLSITKSFGGSVGFLGLGGATTNVSISASISNSFAFGETQTTVNTAKNERQFEVSIPANSQTTISLDIKEISGEIPITYHLYNDDDPSKELRVSGTMSLVRSGDSSASIVTEPLK